MRPVTEFILNMSAGNSGDVLPVMESFYTIQGEGYHSGRPAFFIRLGGCDIGCVWCDVKESWSSTGHPRKSCEEIVAEALQEPSRFVVITGGEPALYDLTRLTRLLHEKGFEIAVETSGAYPLTGEWDWICVSPKKFKAPLQENLVKAHELKVVINHTSDFDWAEKNAAAVLKHCKLFLQPEYDKFEKHIPSIIDYVKLHPEWSISLQTHKIIHVP